MIDKDKVSVIIVTFNSASTIKECLDSIFEQDANFEVIVVDNASSDETIKIVKSYSKVALINAGGNFGFAKANNLGAQKAQSDYLIFLNPDTRLLRKTSLVEMKDTLKNNSDYGVIAPELIFPDGITQPKVRNLPTVWRAIQEYIFKIKGTYDFYQPSCEFLCQVESVTGACMILKKDIFEKIRGFNEKYFMYYEDLQLCKDLKNLGLKVGYSPQIIVEHKEGVSGANQKTQQLLKNSAKLYHGLLGYYLIQLTFIVKLVLNKMNLFK